MRVAILGVGFMGWIHTLAYRQSERAELVGFASRDEKKRSGDWTGIHGNFGPPGEHIDVDGMVVCEDLDGLLKEESIDMIDICLPPHLHVEAVKRSLEAGKKVLCEKPLALTGKDAEELTKLAEPGSLMVAQILPFMLEFTFVHEAARTMKYGKPISGRFQRTISPPDWIPDFYDATRVGGPLIDLQVHDAHLSRLLFGMPKAAHCCCHQWEGVPKRYETLLSYEGKDGVAPVVTLAGGVTDTPGRPFTHGFEVSFEEATVRFEFAAYSDGTSDTIPLTVLHRNGEIERPDLGSGDPVEAFVRQINAVADSVNGQSMHPALDPRIATDAIRICEMQMAANDS